MGRLWGGGEAPPPPVPAEVEAEARELGLPPRDYFPVTPEEKIVAYADKLARGSQVVAFQEALEDMRRSLGKDHPAIKRLKDLHEEIQGWLDHA